MDLLALFHGRPSGQFFAVDGWICQNAIVAKIGSAPTQIGNGIIRRNDPSIGLINTKLVLVCVLENGELNVQEAECAQDLPGVPSPFQAVIPPPHPRFAMVTPSNLSWTGQPSLYPRARDRTCHAVP